MCLVNLELHINLSSNLSSRFQIIHLFDVENLPVNSTMKQTESDPHQWMIHLKHLMSDMQPNGFKIHSSKFSKHHPCIMMYLPILSKHYLTWNNVSQLCTEESSLRQNLMLGFLKLDKYLMVQMCSLRRWKSSGDG